VGTHGVCKFARAAEIPAERKSGQKSGAERISRSGGILRLEPAVGRQRITRFASLADISTVFANLDDNVFGAHLEKAIGNFFGLGFAGNFCGFLHARHEQIQMRDHVGDLGQPLVFKVPRGIHYRKLALCLLFLHELGAGLAVERGQQHRARDKDDAARIGRLLGNILPDKGRRGTGLIEKAAFSGRGNAHHGNGGRRVPRHNVGDVNTVFRRCFADKITEGILADPAGKRDRNADLRQIDRCVGCAPTHVRSDGLYAAQGSRLRNAVHRGHDHICCHTADTQNLFCPSHIHCHVFSSQSGAKQRRLFHFLRQQHRILSGCGRIFNNNIIRLRIKVKGNSTARFCHSITTF